MSKRDGPPKDVPPPTPVNLPRCHPQLPEPEPEPEPVGSYGTAREASPHLTAILQGLTRPADQVNVSHLRALGLHVNPDVSVAELVPDLSCLPDFATWDDPLREDANATNTDFQPELCNGRPAPGASKYVNIRQSLLIDNDRAFGAVRRIPPTPGEKPVRLGYCHDFFRNLESLTGFWDDTSKPGLANHKGAMAVADEHVNSGVPAEDEDYTWCRTNAGSSMPAQFRTQLLTSFLKLVTYDFSCSIMSRLEARLYIKGVHPPAKPSEPEPAHSHSYFSSGCNFIFRMPTDRDSARSGIVEGPIAAVSPRHTTSFPPGGGEREPIIDLGREVIAALITAQHRAREGRKEARIGKDAWWTTKPRWGGGPGGPIGREAEALEGSRDIGTVLVGDKDERPVAAEGSPPDRPAPEASRPASSAAASKSRRPSSSRATGQPPDAKRPRKGLAIYEAYRMVRPPSFNWDPKTKYMHIGMQRGVDYDDVFVFSSLFHHMSILRVRVPDRLLQVLAGAPDQKGRDWGRLEVWRTRWFDFFKPEDRVEAMKVVWGVMAYAMRKVEDETSEADKMEVDGGESRRRGRDGGKVGGQHSRG